MNGSVSKQDLMQELQALCFAKDEAMLFLDTHPQNGSALSYFYDICEKIKKTVEKYEAEYGPLTASGVRGERWTWIEGTWPWQTETSVNEEGGEV